MSVRLSAAAGAAQAAAPTAEALQRAVALVRQGRLDEAGHRPPRSRWPIRTREPAACSVLGAIRIRQQRFDEAVRLLQEAIRLEPRLVGAHLSLAEVYTLRGEAERALPLYRRVLELDAATCPHGWRSPGPRSNKGNVPSRR